MSKIVIMTAKEVKAQLKNIRAAGHNAKPRRRQYSIAFKRQVAEMHVTYGVPVIKLVETNNTSGCNIYNWVKDYKSGALQEQFAVSKSRKRQYLNRVA